MRHYTPSLLHCKLFINDLILKTNLSLYSNTFTPMSIIEISLFFICSMIFTVFKKWVILMEGLKKNDFLI